MRRRRIIFLFFHPRVRRQFCRIILSNGFVPPSAALMLPIMFSSLFNFDRCQQTPLPLTPPSTTLHGRHALEKINNIGIYPGFCVIHGKLSFKGTAHRKMKNVIIQLPSCQIKSWVKFVVHKTFLEITAKQCSPEQLKQMGTCF